MVNHFREINDFYQYKRTAIIALLTGLCMLAILSILDKGPGRGVLLFLFGAIAFDSWHAQHKIERMKLKKEIWTVQYFFGSMLNAIILVCGIMLPTLIICQLVFLLVPCNPIVIKGNLFIFTGMHGIYTLAFNAKVWDYLKSEGEEPE